MHQILYRLGLRPDPAEEIKGAGLLIRGWEGGEGKGERIEEGKG